MGDYAQLGKTDQRSVSNTEFEAAGDPLAGLENLRTDTQAQNRVAQMINQSPRMIAQLQQMRHLTQLRQAQLQPKVPCPQCETNAVVQRAYTETAVDPAGQAAAIASRNGQATRFNVATASIIGEATHTATRQSSGAGPNFHAERNALNTAMIAAEIAGFSNANGTTTGQALHAGNITASDIYTELPPCPECGPYLQNMEAQLAGNVQVSFSDELEGWYEMSNPQKGTAWQRHMDAIAPDEEEDEDDQDAEQQQPQVVAVDAMMDDEDQDAEEEQPQRQLAINGNTMGLEALNGLELVLQQHGVEFFDWNDERTQIQWQGGSSADEVRNTLALEGII